jgi:2-oxoglutarate dehydrogenase E1 component
MGHAKENQLVDISFLESLYACYQSHPEQMDSSWQQFFQVMEAAPSVPITAAKTATDQKARIERLIETYRKFGHLFAHTNPIAIKEQTEPLQLKLDWMGFHPDELNVSFPTLGILPQEQAALADIIQALRSIYCGNTGYEYKECDPPLEQWIQQHVESMQYRKELTEKQRLLILNALNRSELFETFLHTKYVGQKRFSLEGAETLIPMLALLLEEGADRGVQEVLIGMAHRGRLNVLANILNKSYEMILAEFDEGYIPDPSEGMGDVKYHKGYAAEYVTANGKKVSVILPPNPSHLESISPVVEGLSRARQMIEKDELERKKIIPILIHGDAAVSGQGVVYETLQLSQLNGYKTGGTLHFVINNQIGFTTVPQDYRSTCYATSIARAFGIPVFHVNAEDPDSCIRVVLMALEIRQRFHCDLFIDLNCYRKYGHNEGDEPAFTQPLEYRIIRKKRPIRELYHDQLIQQGIIKREMVDLLEEEFKKGMHEAYAKVQEQGRPVKNEPFIEAAKEKYSASQVETGVARDLLVELADRFSRVPEGFQIHPKVGALVKSRLQAVQEEKPIDWGLAESLSYATLLWEGTPVRISGQDSGRGTFSQRHALWVDQVKEFNYFPLANLKEDQAYFEVINSSLSEMGVLGFEYGFSVACPQGLTIWEAQYGDFNNGAQIIIDQYIASGEEKWGQQSGLVLYLPHGYEGQGPEHSSGRLERFLTLAGNGNMTIVNPTTPAQFFHLLRRQIRANLLKPLIIFTPKGLLRLPACSSRLEELVQGSFQTILDDSEALAPIERLIFCSGRIYYDLIAKRTKNQARGIAIVRIEQMHPLDEERLKTIIERYGSAKECFWVQEEPQNMGGWSYMQPYLSALLPNRMPLKYVGRKISANPATGSHYYHEQEQAHILNQVIQT